MGERFIGDGLNPFM